MYLPPEIGLQTHLLRVVVELRNGEGNGEAANLAQVGRRLGAREWD